MIWLARGFGVSLRPRELAETALASIGQRSSHAKETDHEHDIATEIVQYEVAELKIDRDMIRSLAKRLAKVGPDADRIRARGNSALDGKGGIVAALLRSPLVGADLDLTHDRAPLRDIGL